MVFTCTATLAFSEVSFFDIAEFVMEKNVLPHPYPIMFLLH